MNFEPFFCLSGYGYLDSIIQSGGKFIAKIKVLTHPDTSIPRQDDVWIECEVNNATYQLRLTNLLRLVQTGQSVLIQFIAEYCAFRCAYSGQMLDDPSHIIILHGKLHLMKSCYINGLVGKPINTLPQAA